MKLKYIFIVLMIILLNILNGQTAIEIKEMQELYDQYKKEQISKLSQSIDIIKSDEAIDEIPSGSDIFVSKLSIDSLKKQSKFFGYDFFTRRDSIPFWPNISTPENYILGPGDNIEISLWGRAQLNKSYTINHDGNIYDKSIGIIHLSSKTLKETRFFLKNKFAQKISSLLGNNPTSFINVSLGELKSINVHFIGNVNLPGVHLVHPMSTITTGLLLAGGVDTTGSLRKIKIHRNGKLYKEIDLYGYLIDGETSENILLQNNDIVNVPTRLSTITIEGEVYRSGIYEAKQSESFDDIIKFAGGFKPAASNEIILKRIIPITKRTAYIEPVRYKTVMIDQMKKIINQDGDVLTINSIPEIISLITISGQVKNPGAYVLTDSMTVKDLLMRAGGIEDESYLKSTYLNKLKIIRVDINTENSFELEINYNDLLSGKKFDNYLLQRDDHIIVHRNIYYQNDNHVHLSGEILIPGLYSLKRQNEAMNEIIERAGGFTKNAFPDGIQIKRGDKKLAWNNFLINLVKGDSIFIPQKTGIIEVQGEVYNPGLISYQKGRSVMSYIKSAGGLTNNAKRKNISVLYPNGQIIPPKLFFPRTVKEGSIIIVHEKPETKSFDFYAFIEDTLTLMSSAALTYVAYKSLR